jgi:hypothetical protein
MGDRIGREGGREGGTGEGGTGEGRREMDEKRKEWMGGEKIGMEGCMGGEKREG